MAPLAPPIERLISELSKLPSVGRKTAQRFALHLLKVEPAEVRSLVEALSELRERMRFCEVCFNLSDGPRCPVCSDPRRDPTILCVVEDAGNVVAIEKANAFQGVYHVLGGALSPLKDIGPDDLRVGELLERVRRDGIREVILATNPNVEGEATAVYLSRLLKPAGVAVSRLAQGLPAGADLEFIDELTLQRALEGRREY